MPARRAWTWVGFGGSAVLLAGAVSVLTVAALRADADERRAHAEAARAADVRLALWRIDSTLQPLLAREGARSPEHYLPGHGAGLSDPHVLLHFDVAPDGTVTSPEASAADMPDQVSARAATRLLRLRQRLDGDQLRVLVAANDTMAPQQTGFEYQARVANIANANQQAAELASAPSAVAGPMKPLWQDRDLFLVRRAEIFGEPHLQGAWLDWVSLRAELLAEVAALLPGADLVASDPAAVDAGAPPESLLAALPAELDAGPPPVPAPRSTTLVAVLALAWVGVLAAIGAGGGLLAGTLRLGARRAAFVAAVTHELRTPLTTLTTYSEMLADERVTDPAQRRRYLDTLVREAGRLGGLIENVLAYSRIERGRPGLSDEALDAAAMLDRCTPRLSDRAAAAGAELVITPPAAGLGFRGDPVAVDQILFNLVDNACKHAAAAEPRRIEIDVAAAGERLRFRVRDFGPGIADAERRRIFVAFRRAADTSGPGVGLGLPLCRRLARAMGGDLVLGEADGPGACFELTLPAT